jgi:hypothetical protein
MQEVPRPVFVIGCYRSGTSILTWCLGQHPNILPLEETNWIGRLSMDLNHLYQLGICGGAASHLGSFYLESSAFYRFFGRAVDQFVQETKSELLEANHRRVIEKIDPGAYRKIVGERSAAARPQTALDTVGGGEFAVIRSKSDPKRRWVDGTPENSELVYGLSQMFPEAKFIHILRHPDKVAHSLMHFSAMGQQDYAQEEAYRTWLRLVRQCKLAEDALGSDQVLRVYQEELESDPQALLWRCLSFVGEPFHPDCLLPLRQRINSSGTWGQSSDQKGALDENVLEAHSLYDLLLSEKGLDKPPSLQAFKRMESEFLASCRLPLPPELRNRPCREFPRKEEPAPHDGSPEASNQPLFLKAIGPEGIRAGRKFNVQPSGQSAIWAIGRAVTLETVMVLNETELPSTVEPEAGVVTALVPSGLCQSAGTYPVYLRDSASGVRSNTLLLKVE